MIVSAREFTSAAEMRAAAAAVHARCFSPKIRPAVRPLPAISVSMPAVPKLRKLRPLWMRQPVSFDEHIVAFRIAIRIKQMRDSGEIEVVEDDRPTVLRIVTEVLRDFPGVTVGQLRGPSQVRSIAFPRQVAIYEVRTQRPDLSFPVIGRWFGGRDHTTAIHAYRKIEALRASA